MKASLLRKLQNKALLARRLLGAITFIILFSLCLSCSSGGTPPSASESQPSDQSGSDNIVQNGGSLGAFTDLSDLNGPTGLNWLYTRIAAINGNGGVDDTPVYIVGSSLSAPSAFIWQSSPDSLADGSMNSLGEHYGFYDDYYGDTGTSSFVWSYGIDVNNNGLAVGNSSTGSSEEQRAFVSDGAGYFVDLAPVTLSVSGAGFVHVVKNFSEAVAINDNGYVILNVEEEDGIFAYYWDGSSTVIVDTGVEDDPANGEVVPHLFQLSRIYGAPDSKAVALNEHNEYVVNSGDTAIYGNIDTGFSQVLGTILDDEIAVAVDINNPYESDDPDVNHVGAQIIGTSGDLGFLWEGSAMTRINSLGGDSCHPTDINNLGRVVGNATTTSGKTHAFLWQIVDAKPVMTDLGTLGGDNSYATAINDDGVVVGYAETGRYFVDATGSYPIAHAFLWKDGIMYDLGVHNDFYDYPFIDSYPFSEAVGISAAGRVVGNSYTINSNYRGFALAPVFP